MSTSDWEQPMWLGKIHCVCCCIYFYYAIDDINFYISVYTNFQVYNVHVVPSCATFYSYMYTSHSLSIGLNCTELLESLRFLIE